jgi:hypothetical protein
MILRLNDRSLTCDGMDQVRAWDWMMSLIMNNNVLKAYPLSGGPRYGGVLSSIPKVDTHHLDEI